MVVERYKKSSDRLIGAPVAAEAHLVGHVGVVRLCVGDGLIQGDAL